MGAFLRRQARSPRAETALSNDRGRDAHAFPHASTLAAGLTVGLQGDIELQQQTHELLHLLAREIGQREIQLFHHQRHQALDHLATRGREIQFHLAAVAVPARSLEQAALRQLVDDPRQRAAVVAELSADVLGVDRDAVAQPGQNLVLDEGESMRLEHRLQDVQHQGIGPLDEVADAGLRPVGRSLIMLLRHLVPRHLLPKYVTA